jgi:4-hydroxy-3-methylbut-2-enyl diphosphate reductase
VAGKHSSNGKFLYSVCAEVNPNSHTVTSTAEIDPSWFIKGESVGICGATSTPKWLMEEIRDFLSNL